MLVLAENEIKKSLTKFDPWMSMVRLSRWLYQGNVFVLIFDLVQHVAPLFCSGHWHNYFLQLGQAVRASVQSIFLRCLWFWRVIGADVDVSESSHWFKSFMFSYFRVFSSKMSSSGDQFSRGVVLNKSNVILNIILWNTWMAQRIFEFSII